MSALIQLDVIRQEAGRLHDLAQTLRQAGESNEEVVHPILDARDLLLRLARECDERTTAGPAVPPPCPVCDADGDGESCVQDGELVDDHPERQGEPADGPEVWLAFGDAVHDDPYVFTTQALAEAYAEAAYGPLDPEGIDQPWRVEQQTVCGTTRTARLIAEQTDPEEG